MALAPIFSTCSRRQYAAVVLTVDKRVAGLGYNGAPPGMPHCIDGGCPRGRLGTAAHGLGYDSGPGLCVAQHAEQGALLHSDPALRRGGTLIVNGPPCMTCARLIASAHVRRVICLEDPSYSAFGEVEDFLFSAGIEVWPVDRSTLWG